MYSMLYEYHKQLEAEARNLGYRISISSTVNKACHEYHYLIFIKQPTCIEQIYSFAHEIGHCIDFKRGKLDFDRYRINKNYRLRKEFVAWYFGFKVCVKLKIPIKIQFIKHSLKCLYSYF